MNVYPQTPLEAMQCKLAALAAVPQMRQEGTFLGETPKHLQVFDTALRWSQLYHWSRHTAQQVLDASETYPLDPHAPYLQPGRDDTDPPYPALCYGFLTFDGPVLPPLPGYASQGPISAVLIVPVEQRDGPCYRFYGLNWDGGGYATPTFNTQWPPANMTGTLVHHAELLMQFFLTASQFVEQKICVEGTAALSRTGRKLADRAGITPVVHTIQLRRREHAVTDPHGDHHIEYSCRWLVRGHWRQQPYPKTGDVRPLFIEPYIKGPDDQPLKTPVPDVFVVKR